MPTLKIITLGRTRATLDDTEIVWHAASARELFFYLLSFPDGRTQRDVALALWPDEENENAASSNRFRAALHRVRAALEDADSVVKAYERYRLSPEVLAISDVCAMQSALQDAQLATMPKIKQLALQRAVDLYGGEYLPDVRIDWARTAREEYKSSYVRAMLELSKLHYDAGESN
ncbi:AfsR/SARP family transcriptional regulator, partial [Deinococcus alpinitundrae]|uniref:AfsR/SARP family transcriptional regulator n=1 Tax=Deinococcus alpinitundrae TaxID=468913 RepID=UPI003F672461